MKAKLFYLTMSLVMVLSLAVAAVKVAPVEPVGAQCTGGEVDVLWGVTAVDFGTSGEYSQVFKVNTGTGEVTIIKDDPGDPLYSAITTSEIAGGWTYAIGRSTNDDVLAPDSSNWPNFNDLYRLDSDTGEVVHTWENELTSRGKERCNSMWGYSALTGHTLVLLEGPGVCPEYGYEDGNGPTGPEGFGLVFLNEGLFGLQPPDPDVIDELMDQGVIECDSCPANQTTCSDGDISAYAPNTSIRGSFWAPEGSGIGETPCDILGCHPENSVYLSQSGIPYIGGFNYNEDGSTAYAGSLIDEKLYLVDVEGGGHTVLFDLDPYLAGPIMGLEFAGCGPGPTPTPTPTPTATATNTPTPTPTGSPTPIPAVITLNVTHDMGGDRTSWVEVIIADAGGFDVSSYDATVSYASSANITAISGGDAPYDSPNTLIDNGIHEASFDQAAAATSAPITIARLNLRLFGCSNFTDNLDVTINSINGIAVDHGPAALVFRRGDTDCNGSVTMADAFMAAQWAVKVIDTDFLKAKGMESPVNAPSAKGDTPTDKISMADAFTIAQSAVKVLDCYFQ